MEIALTRSTLRPWRADDLAALVRSADATRIADNLVDAFPSPYTEADGRRWIAERNTDDPPRHFAIVVDGEASGGIGVNLGTDVRRRSAEFGYWLAVRHWGKGIMTEAAIAVVAYVFAKFDIEHVFSGVFERNRASARVLEKAGFALEGRLRRHITKLGVTMDNLIYGIVRGEERVPG